MKVIEGVVDLGRVEHKLSWDDQLIFDESVKGLTILQRITKGLWGKIDLDEKNIRKYVWKDNPHNVMIVNQVTMLLGELGEILRDIYLEPDDDNHKPNSDDAKDAGNVLLHSLMLYYIVCKKTGEEFGEPLKRALIKMSNLSDKYNKKYFGEKY